MKILKHDIKLAEKYKAWKEFRSRPYSRYGNVRRNHQEMKREKRETFNKGGPLTSAISELIPENIKLKLSRIK